MVYYVVAVLGVLLSSVGQVFMKKGAISGGGRKRRGIGEFINLPLIVGMTLMLIVSVMNVFAMKYVELKEFSFILPLGYVFVPILSFIFIGERFTAKRILSISIILLGVIVFNFGKFLDSL